MIKYSFQMILLLVLGIGFGSCSPKFYTPNTQNVPLISEKGETNLALSGNPNQAEFQGAYGVSDNIAIIANGGLFFPSDLDNGNGGSGNFVELGGGYFKAISNSFLFETYAIFGLGSFENHLPSTRANHPGTLGNISSNIVRIGIQPNIGYKSKYFSAALSSRFVNLSYNKIKGDLIFEGADQAAYLSDNSSNYLIEPAITVRGGLEKFKMQVQYGYSLNMTNGDFRQDKSYLTVGINFHF